MVQWIKEEETEDEAEEQSEELEIEKATEGGTSVAIMGRRVSSEVLITWGEPLLRLASKMRNSLIFEELNTFVKPIPNTWLVEEMSEATAYELSSSLLNERFEVETIINWWKEGLEAFAILSIARIGLRKVMDVNDLVINVEGNLKLTCFYKFGIIQLNEEAEKGASARAAVGMLHSLRYLLTYHVNLDTECIEQAYKIKQTILDAPLELENLINFAKTI